MPPALTQKPERRNWMDLYLKAFDKLSKRRLIIFSPQPIQYTEISEYADRNNIDDIELFESLIWALDSAYLDRQNQKEKNKVEVPKRGARK